MQRHSWPVVREHRAAERVSLDVPDAGPAGPLQAEVEESGAAEQAEEAHLPLPPLMPPEARCHIFPERAMWRPAPPPWITGRPFPLPAAPTLILRRPPAQ